MTLTKNNEELRNVMDIKFETIKSEPIVILNDREFEKAKQVILKCFYVGVYKIDNTLSFVCDNGKYYVINMDNISKENLKSTFSFIKPKKIVFDITNYGSILTDDSKGFIDIKLAVNLLFNKELKTINKFIVDFKIPKNARENIYLLYTNLIKIAKSINIYVEKNNLNKAYYAEMDTSILMCNVAKRGVDVNLIDFEAFTKNINEEIKEINIEFKEKYGDDFDFNDKQKILKAIKEGSRSLDSKIMNSSDNLLYDKYKKYILYKWVNSLSSCKEKIYFDYSLYDDFQIKSNLLIEGNFYSNDNVKVIKGEFGSLYYKIFAELTRNNDLIIAASENDFIEYINKVLFPDRDEEISIYTDVIIRCYASGVLDHFEVQEYAIEKYDTVLNVGDISNFNHRIKEYLGDIYTFIKDFDGLAPEYDRYNKKIFTPDSSLDGYIKQIINMIFKLSLLEIEKMTRDYTEKRKRKDNDNVKLTGVGKNFMLLSVTGEDAKQMAIDNLNRAMYTNFKYFIKNTKVYNTTSPINSKSTRYQI